MIIEVILLGGYGTRFPWRFIISSEIESKNHFSTGT